MEIKKIIENRQLYFETICISHRAYKFLKFLLFICFFICFIFIQACAFKQAPNVTEIHIHRHINEKKIEKQDFKDTKNINSLNKKDNIIELTVSNQLDSEIKDLNKSFEKSSNKAIFKDYIAIGFNIKGATKNDEGLQYFKDELRARILKIKGIKFLIVEPQKMIADFILHGKISTKIGKNSYGFDEVTMNLNDFKLVCTYNSKNIPASIISSVPISTTQTAEGRERALIMASLAAIIHLEQDDFFKNLKSNELINTWNKGTIVFKSKSNSEDITKLKKIIKKEISTVYCKITKINEIFTNNSKKISKHLDKIENNYNKIINNFINDSPEMINNNKEQINQIPLKNCENDIYEDTSAILIYVPENQLNPTPLTNIVDENGYKIKSSIKYEKKNVIDDDDDKLIQIAGIKPFKINASVINNQILISNNNKEKLQRLKAYNNNILMNPGVFVIY